MENKTKEQLAEEYANECEDCYSNDYLGFIRGYDSRQPEIDRLKNIISGKTFHDETEVLKTEIDALKEQMPKWISVEDELPEDYVPYSYTETKYLVYTEKPTGFFIEMAEWFTSDCEDVKSHFNLERPYFGYDIKITHWQPLPNTTKQKKQ